MERWRSPGLRCLSQSLQPLAIGSAGEIRATNLMQLRLGGLDRFRQIATLRQFARSNVPHDLPADAAISGAGKHRQGQRLKLAGKVRWFVHAFVAVSSVAP